MKRSDVGVIRGKKVLENEVIVNGGLSYNSIYGVKPKLLESGILSKSKPQTITASYTFNNLEIGEPLK